MWFVFRRSRKRTTFPSLARAKRARDAKNAFRLCPPLKYYCTNLILDEKPALFRFAQKSSKRDFKGRACFKFKKSKIF
ncbi:MAG: hypothetical protein U5L45_25715 [Saprospiraceae bacterium]|nr:hypothetical protein [Saprospiraceae bacterium]